jgi:hypothetical protein
VELMHFSEAMIRDGFSPCWQTKYLFVINHPNHPQRLMKMPEAQSLIFNRKRQLIVGALFDDAARTELMALDEALNKLKALRKEFYSR